MLKETIGQRVRNRREHCGLTQIRLAVAAGVSLSTLRSIERGHRYNTSIDVLDSIAAALGTSISTLTSEEQSIDA